jgi:hypothetical protein
MWKYIRGVAKNLILLGCDAVSLGAWFSTLLFRIEESSSASLNLTRQEIRYNTWKRQKLRAWQHSVTPLKLDVWEPTYFGSSAAPLSGGDPWRRITIEIKTSRLSYNSNKHEHCLPFGVVQRTFWFCLQLLHSNPQYATHFCDIRLIIDLRIYPHVLHVVSSAEVFCPKLLRLFSSEIPTR